MNSLDVVCLGETLVDFLPADGARGKKVREVPTWTRCLGGAPANVAVGVSRLGAKSAICGVTGDDELGWFLHEELEREGVDVSHLRHSKDGKTGLGFVSLTTTGERSFLFYRENAAELLLDPSDADHAFFARAKVLHLGTNSLLRPKAREASLGSAQAAKARGQLVSCDPNLRLHLWKDPRELFGLLRQLLPNAAVVKLSDEEIEFVTESSKPEDALQVLASLGVALPVVTLGAKGAVASWRGELLRVEAPKVEVVDTTGAGDGFMAGLLQSLTSKASSRAELDALDAPTITGCLRFGCRVGSRVVTKLGAVAGLPRSGDV